ncbi:hypothetical protein GKIL_4131 [Gloeobacter kilaueensis JS1]|uniref:Uncharacterized protein n=1 Tax=Gloeobacter kilaueensis (strain ATCC BAA-2537 / CCAP 1431/1 / ULC 316 / JS1) TaxID=1183438 RepID=U5QN25_GLOK1|nr:hypothetical protein GKIL_3007 [Gloeobacter kilaueensis JS1]AGY59612.1 hypothetical protein GKIL_3366 [Gloeobacter kilaueensis JS1]AGY60377.1 hypothetical protein GKIL_4131 [Gloeobacter kilaueensis JS1]
MHLHPPLLKQSSQVSRIVGFWVLLHLLSEKLKVFRCEFRSGTTTLSLEQSLQAVVPPTAEGSAHCRWGTTEVGSNLRCSHAMHTQPYGLSTLAYTLRNGEVVAEFLEVVFFLGCQVDAMIGHG